MRLSGGGNPFVLPSKPQEVHNDEENEEDVGNNGEEGENIPKEGETDNLNQGENMAYRNEGSSEVNAETNHPNQSQQVSADNPMPPPTKIEVVKKKKPKRKAFGLDDNANNDQEQTKPASVPSQTPKANPPHQSTINAPKRQPLQNPKKLFDDDEDNIQTPSLPKAPPKVETQKPTAAKKLKGLFDDDEDE